MGNPLRVLRTGKFWYEFIIMTFAIMVSGAAVYYFLVPSKIVLGSVAGLAMVLEVLLAKIGIIMKMSLIVTILNVILLALAILLIGKEFGAKTIYTALILGPCMDFWERVLPYENLLEAGNTSIMGDIWMDMLAFVLLVSISQAILFNINASSGGLDILAKIINKYMHLDIGTSVTLCGVVICCLALLINPFRVVVAGIIGTWINGVAIDYFIAGINKRKRVCVITTEYDKVRQYIIDVLHRGCSLYEVYGGFKMDKGMEVQALLTQTEFAQLMNYIRENDLHAFITAGNVSEVYGLWNKHK